jgi:hypothetical protein
VGQGEQLHASILHYTIEHIHSHKRSMLEAQGDSSHKLYSDDKLVGQDTQVGIRITDPVYIK